MKNFLFISVLFCASIQLSAQQQLNLPASRDKQLNEQYCTGIFSTEDAVYFDMLDDRTNQSAVAYFNVLDWLQGRVAGLRVFRTRSNTSVPVIRNSLAGVFVDEFRTDYSQLNAIPVSDIAMVKIIRGPFIGSMGTPGGAILIYTKSGADSGEDESSE